MYDVNAACGCDQWLRLVIACSTGTWRHLASRAAGDAGLGAGGGDLGRAAGRGHWRMIACPAAQSIYTSMLLDGCLTTNRIEHHICLNNDDD